MKHAARAGSWREHVMTAPRFIVIDGKRHLWRDILKLRREQVQAAANAKQPALFELIDDARPPAERTAAGRYLEPTLFAHAGKPRRGRDKCG
jgi:hypothetical protein